MPASWCPGVTAHQRHCTGSEARGMFLTRWQVGHTCGLAGAPPCLWINPCARQSGHRSAAGCAAMPRYARSCRITARRAVLRVQLNQATRFACDSKATPPLTQRPGQLWASLIRQFEKPDGFALGVPMRHFCGGIRIRGLASETPSCFTSGEQPIQPGGK